MIFTGVAKRLRYFLFCHSIVTYKNKKINQTWQYTPHGYILKIPPKGIETRCGSWKKKSAVTAHSEKKSVPPRNKKLIHRLNRIEGQIRGIKGMVENNAYCPDILIQSAAVNAAINAFNKELLANHIRTCVADDIRNGKDESIDELVVTLQKLMK